MDDETTTTEEEDEEGNREGRLSSEFDGFAKTLKIEWCFLPSELFNIRKISRPRPSPDTPLQHFSLRLNACPNIVRNILKIPRTVSSMIHVPFFLFFRFRSAVQYCVSSGSNFERRRVLKRLDKRKTRAFEKKLEKEKKFVRCLERKICLPVKKKNNPTKSDHI